MKNILLLIAASLSLAACSNTWQGAKADTANNVERAGDAVKSGGRAVGEGLSNTGEKLQEISQ